MENPNRVAVFCMLGIFALAYKFRPGQAPPAGTTVFIVGISTMVLLLGALVFSIWAVAKKETRTLASVFTLLVVLGMSALVGKGMADRWKQIQTAKAKKAEQGAVAEAPRASKSAQSSLIKDLDEQAVTMKKKVEAGDASGTGAQGLDQMLELLEKNAASLPKDSQEQKLILSMIDICAALRPKLVTFDNMQTRFEKSMEILTTPVKERAKFEALKNDALAIMETGEALKQEYLRQPELLKTAMEKRGITGVEGNKEYEGFLRGHRAQMRPLNAQRDAEVDGANAIIRICDRVLMNWEKWEVAGTKVKFSESKLQAQHDADDTVVTQMLRKKINAQMTLLENAQPKSPPEQKAK